MSKLRLFQVSENKYEVDASCESIGVVMASRNSFHADSCYISLFLDSYDKGIAKELFDLLRVELNQPLQAMLDSYRQDQIDFLLPGSFILKRRYYEVEITAEDLYALVIFTATPSFQTDSNPSLPFRYPVFLQDIFQAHVQSAVRT